MKNHLIIKSTAMLLCIAAFALAGTGCARSGEGLISPTASPAASPTATAGASPSPKSTEAPSAGPSAEASPSAETTAEASPSADAGDISGFMEGGIVDPDDVPQLTAWLERAGGYDDARIQSVTYKLYEGRQAYYVVLNGADNAERRVYVFADGTVTPAE